MSFQIQTQQINTGDTATFTFPAPVGAYVYGITAFELNAGSNPQQITTAAISLTPVISDDSTVITLTADVSLYQGQTDNNWVQVTILAWLGSENPPGIYLFNRTGLGPGISVEPVPLNGQPVVGVGVISGFDLTFTGGSSTVEGLGASSGFTLSPYSTATQAVPIGEGLLIGSNNNPSSNTVDTGSVILTDMQNNVAAGMYFDNNSTYGVNSCSVTTPGVVPTQVAVFLQSFYVQYQITSSLNPTPDVSYVQVGASSIEANSTGFSFSSTRELTDSAYPVEEGEYVNFYVINAASYAATYFYVALAGPSASGISANNNGTTAGGIQVTITGTNFADGAEVFFGVAQANLETVQVVSSTEITATSPPSPVEGPVDVYVATSAGLSQKNSDCQFTYSLAVPTITSVAPSSGSMDANTTVAISGSGLGQSDGQPAITAVMFGNVAGKVVSYDADKGTLMVTSPTSSTETTVNIIVTNSAGSSEPSYTGEFTYSSQTEIVKGRLKDEV